MVIEWGQRTGIDAAPHGVNAGIVGVVLVSQVKKKKVMEDMEPRMSKKQAMKSFIRLLFRPWSKWQDVTIFDFGGYMFLLQGRIHRISGRKQFAARAMGQWWRTARPHPGEVSADQIQFEP